MDSFVVAMPLNLHAAIFGNYVVDEICLQYSVTVGCISLIPKVLTSCRRRDLMHPGNIVNFGALHMLFVCLFTLSFASFCFL